MKYNANLVAVVFFILVLFVCVFPLPKGNSQEVTLKPIIVAPNPVGCTFVISSIPLNEGYIK